MPNLRCTTYSPGMSLNGSMELFGDARCRRRSRTRSPQPCSARSPTPPRRRLLAFSSLLARDSRSSSDSYPPSAESFALVPASSSNICWFSNLSRTRAKPSLTRANRRFSAAARDEAVDVARRARATARDDDARRRRRRRRRPRRGIGDGHRRRPRRRPALARRTRRRTQRRPGAWAPKTARGPRRSATPPTSWRVLPRRRPRDLRAELEFCRRERFLHLALLGHLGLVRSLVQPRAPRWRAPTATLFSTTRAERRAVSVLRLARSTGFANGSGRVRRSRGGGGGGRRRATPHGARGDPAALSGGHIGRRRLRGPPCAVSGTDTIRRHRRSRRRRREA